MPTFRVASTVMRVVVAVPPVVEAMVKSGVFAAVVAELLMESWHRARWYLCHVATEIVLSLALIDKSPN